MENKLYIDIEYVKDVMQVKGITEKELSERMSVALPTIKKFLSGATQHGMRGTFICKLAKVLDVSAQSLLQRYINDTYS